MSADNPSDIEALPPEARREALAEKNRPKPQPTKEQVDLAVTILRECKDYSKVTTLISEVSKTLQDALAR
jgi:hypothetical protein